MLWVHKARHSWPCIITWGRWERRKSESGRRSIRYGRRYSLRERARTREQNSWAARSQFARPFCGHPISLMANLGARKKISKRSFELAGRRVVGDGDSQREGVWDVSLFRGRRNAAAAPIARMRRGSRFVAFLKPRCEASRRAGKADILHTLSAEWRALLDLS